MYQGLSTAGAISDFKSGGALKLLSIKACHGMTGGGLLRGHSSTSFVHHARGHEKKIQAVIPKTALQLIKLLNHAMKVLIKKKYCEKQEFASYIYF